MTSRLTAACASFVCCICFFFGYADLVSGSNIAMRGPGETASHARHDQDMETSSVNIALLGMVSFFRNTISRADGPDRCGFRPSCSAYGYRAIKEHGPVIGTLMTGDRLIRCNIWKRPGTDYILLPNGKLFDPVSANVLFE